MSKLCQCGCGQYTKPAKQKQKGYKQGEFQRWVQGHGSTHKPPAVRLREDRCLRGHTLSIVGVNAKGHCRQCGRESTARTHARNPISAFFRGRRRNLRAYGLTPELWMALVEQQEGRCAICRRFPPPWKPTLHIDHDHESKKIRGLLCAECNVGLGKFHDALDVLRAAVAYLERAQGAISLAFPA